MNPDDGILLIDKNEGDTSFSVVRGLKKILGIKKVGHAGTLDPFATGLLIVLLGQGTKLSPYLMVGDKLYRATMRLGVETDTQDPTGRVVETRPVPKIEPEHIRDKAREFIGEIEQNPPVFSALNYKGKRAYDFARRGIKIELPKRKVKVHSLKIISVDLPDITMEVSCSSGTYIRSLAATLGSELGPGAHLRSLKRLASGPFSVDDALNLERRKVGTDTHFLRDRIIPLMGALPQMEETQVEDQTAQRIRSGQQPNWEEVVRGSDLTDSPREAYLKIVTDTELVAIVKAGGASGCKRRSYELMRVFN